MRPHRGLMVRDALRAPHHEEETRAQTQARGGTTMGKREVVTEQPRYIKLNTRDNVAIVVNDFGLPSGSRFPCGLELRAFVPQGHKTALVDIGEGDPILRYGEVIGTALSLIQAGEWVDEGRIRMPEAPPLDKLEISTAVPAP